MCLRDNEGGQLGTRGVKTKDQGREREGTRTFEPNGPCFKWEKDQTQEDSPYPPTPKSQAPEG